MKTQIDVSGIYMAAKAMTRLAEALNRLKRNIDLKPKGSKYHK